MGDSSESGPSAGGESLEDAARDEREVATNRLREELRRDPSDEEVNEWLRRHTEGY